MVKSGTRLLILNWWIGSTVMVPSSSARQSGMTFLRNVIHFSHLFAHDLFRKPGPTFRDHALNATSLVFLLPVFARTRGRVRRRRPITQCGAGNDSRGAHHIEHARDEAEQKKHNEPPGRDTEQPVDQPADAGTDQHASNEFAREPEAPGVARCSRRPISTRTFGRRARTLAC